MITPDRELRVEVAIEMDNGEIGNFIGYRVQHDNARGPFKGGLRYHPARRPGRGPLARQPDDLEDGRRRHPLRRGQGRHELRPGQALPGRAGAGHPAVRPADPRLHRPPQGHPRARHGHRRPGDGLDHERVRQIPRLPAGLRDGQAGRVPRLGRSRGRHRLRHRDLHPRDAQEAGPSHPRHDVRDPGLRQRRVVRGQVPPRAGRPDRGRLRRLRGHPPSRGAGYPRARLRTSHPPARWPASRAARRRRTSSCLRWRSTS